MVGAFAFVFTLAYTHFTFTCCFLQQNFVPFLLLCALTKPLLAVAVQTCQDEVVAVFESNRRAAAGVAGAVALSPVVSLWPGAMASPATAQAIAATATNGTAQLHGHLPAPDPAIPNRTTAAATR